jgi:xylan 1,4-beta-xylosidase
VSLPLQKAGHGELVETPAGEWYLAHLASRPLKTGTARNSTSPDQSASADAHAGDRCVLGRETCLQRVEWREGWLRLVTGGTKPQLTVALPADRQVLACASPLALSARTGPSEGSGGLAQPKTPPRRMRDEFDSPALDVHWSSLRVPADESWLSLTERRGWLRLRGRDSQHSLFDQSLVARRVQHFKYTAETCLEFVTENFMQSAGLICYYDTRTHFYLRATRDESRGKILGIALTDDGSYDELSAADLVVNDWKQIFLRAEVDFQKLQFSASPDGKSWQGIGPVLDASKLSDDYGAGLHFTGSMVGLCAQDVSGAKRHADFDYFDYRPTNP